jgi:2-iminobutanoate/2-iminopropanoate deaminase
MNGLEAVSTNEAPQAIGPYSQAMWAGDFLYCSGQIALDPATGQMTESTVEGQAERVMKNLEAILKSQGLTFGHVARATIYLLDMGQFAKVNEIYGRYLKAPFPARATVQVSRLPKDALVEIDVIAYKGKR